MNREDFKILDTKIYGKPLVYLDNAATTQKPQCVVDAERELYMTMNANVHRGVHYLSEQMTERMEQARDRVRRFIGADKVSEIIFTRGTTESINLVASSFGELLHEGDEIIITEMEHHSNIVPWQLLRERRGIRLRIVLYLHWGSGFCGLGGICRGEYGGEHGNSRQRRKDTDCHILLSGR